MKEAVEEHSRIAVVGMAGRFPGAPDGDTFWANLQAGKEAIQFLNTDQLLAAGVPLAQIRHPDFVPACAQLPEVDRFDAGFFGYSSREAELMDPQFRLFLEVAYEAFEHAGCDPTRLRTPVGVFAGSAISSYLLFNVQPAVGFHQPIDFVTNLVGNDKDYLAATLAYKLNLSGPAVSMNTACSTGLVCLHYACTSLLTGECDMALAGAAAITFPQQTGYRFQTGSMMSPDGRCCPFDRRAAGTVFGDGVGVVILKRLEDALADGDTVHAVILGTAVNNDGANRVGFTAPGVEGQKRVIREALNVAGVGARTIQYVEAHGTGTLLGDSIEVAALTQAFREETQDSGFCALGSVKSNIGHARSAAGMASLLKVIYALKHRQIPPTLHIQEPHELLQLGSSPFYLADTLAPWSDAEGPRRAGVSSFGIGGTNAHVILEEAPRESTAPSPLRAQILPLSARSEVALHHLQESYRGSLSAARPERLADMAFTAQMGRQTFDCRTWILARSGDGFRSVLLHEPTQPPTLNQAKSAPVCLVIPDELERWGEIGRSLYENLAVFRAEVASLLPRLTPEERERWPGHSDALTALITAYALLRSWERLGLKPDRLLGVGIGEVAAACWLGTLPLDDALAIARARTLAGSGEVAEGPGAFQYLRPAVIEDPVARDTPGLWLNLGVSQRLGAAPPDEAFSPYEEFLIQVANLWQVTGSVDWRVLHQGESRRRVSLPTYAYERQHHWIEPVTPQAAPAPLPSQGPVRAEPAPVGTIVAIWTELLEVPLASIDPQHSDFYELGGSSLLMVELVERLVAAFGPQIDKRRLLAATTVQEMLLAVTVGSSPAPQQNGAASPRPAFPHLADCALPADIRPAGAAAAPAPAMTRRALLTGSTGFLGTYLLDELLTNTDCQIVCLIRCPGPAEGLQRLRAARLRLGLAPTFDHARVTVVAGDLERPQLGLTETVFRQLADEVDHIFHTGARVNFVETYETLRGANVQACHEVLRLACHGRVKPVHYVSTLAICQAQEHEETTRLLPPEGLMTGYEQTKWVAEQLFQAARQRGIPVHMYRSGIVGGDQRSGLTMGTGLFWLLLTACIRLGLAPEMSVLVDVVPVDMLARGIVRLSRGSEGSGRDYNIANRRPTEWAELIGALNALGHVVRTVPLARWRAELRNSSRAEAGQLTALLAWFGDELPPAVLARVPWCSEPTTRRSLEQLAEVGVRAPDLVADLLPQYVKALLQPGDAPRRGGESRRKVGSLEELLTVSSPIPARVVQTAAALQVWDALAGGPLTAGELARRLDAQARGISILLDALWALGLVTKNAGRYGNTPYAMAHLVGAGPEFHGNWLLLNHSVWQDWLRLPEAVRYGTQGLTTPLFFANPEQTGLLLTALAQRARQSVGGMLACLDLPEEGRFLDVGGGFGGFVVGVLARFPRWRGILFDLPPVCTRAREYLAAHPVANRLTFRAGDFHRAELPAGNDLVLLSAILHGQSREQNRSLLAKVYRALKPGGMLVVRDYFPPADPVAPDESALLAVQLLLGSDHGEYYPREAVAGWLEEAGLSCTFLPESTHLLLAHKGA